MTRFALALWKTKVFWAIENNKKRQLFMKDLKTPKDLSDSLEEIFSIFKEIKIDDLAVIRGPGSFTGLRVLLASVQGILVSFPHLRVFSPTFFDVVAFHSQKRPLMVLAEPHGDMYLGKMFDNTEELFFQIPQRDNIEIFDLVKEEIHWAECLLNIPWDPISQDFPMPFYGYEPVYKKKFQ